MRDDEIRLRLTEANPWWRAAGGGDPTLWTSGDRLLNARRESEIGHRAKILDDLAETPLTDALVLLQGPRRVGKSVAVRELALALLKRSDVDPRQVIAFSCDAMSAQDFTRAFRLGRELTRTVDSDVRQRRVWLVDEVGQIRGWWARLKALRDATEVGADTVIATSSSWRQEEDVQGNLLAGRAGTSLMRRVRLLLPLSFREYVASTRTQLGMPAMADPADLQTNAVAEELEAFRFDLDAYDLAWQAYLTCGGFPRSVAHAERLPGFDMAFVRDVAAYLRVDIDKEAPPESLPRLLGGLASRSTSPLSVNKAYAELGYRSRDICDRRLHRIVNAYGALWCTRRADDGGPAPGAQAKLYLVDPLLAWLPSLLRSGMAEPNFTALTEQALGVALARAIERAEEGRWLGGDTIGLARTETDNEIDFCPIPLPAVDRMTVPIESKWSPQGRRSRVVGHRRAGAKRVAPVRHNRRDERHTDGGGQVPSITQAELERRLWDAANALRGPVDPGDFKNYVFPVLFWKWLSDTYAWERAQAVADFGEDIDPEVEADYHRFALPDGTSWGEVTTKTANLGHAIATAFARIQQANPTTLAGVFGDAAWGNKERLPEAALVNLLNAFNGLRLDPDHVAHDLLGGAYEYLLKQFAEAAGAKAGEFFTPRTVVRLIVQVLDPQPGEDIVDPACGSGGMLVETINTVRDHGGDTRTLRLYGQEQNLTTAGIARMNLFLHDIEDFAIVRGDTLREPAYRDPAGHLRTFDMVIANPPFSLKNWGQELWAADPRAFCGVPPRNNADMAWIQHMIASTKPGTGRVGVVMPHGVLFRGGAEGAIRRCLIEKDLLEAVIGLPPNLFYSTSIPACVLVFRTAKPDPRKGRVLFVDGSARFAKGKNQNTMTDDDAAAILAAYRTGEDPEGEGGVNVRLVPYAEIEANGFDLNIGRYLTTTSGEEIDLDTALDLYLRAREARIAAEHAMFQRLAAAGIDIGGDDE